MFLMRTLQSPAANRHPRGIAMLLVLIALAMATVIGLSFLNTQATTTGISRNISNQTRARGVAESALEMTINYIRTHPDEWREKFNDQPLSVKQQLGSNPDETFVITVEDGTLDAAGNSVPLENDDGDPNKLSTDASAPVVIKAIGYYKGVAAHTVKAQVAPASGTWSGKDIGYTTPAGSNTLADNDVYTLNGAGNDIWNNSDGFRYVYQKLTGDGQLTARVTSITSDHSLNGWAKSGVMVRETLDPESRHAMVVVTPSNGVAFQYRQSTGGSSSNSNGGSGTPYWVRIVRAGDVLTGYKSSDGSTWVQTGTVTLDDMPESLYVGLCLTSHDGGHLCTSTIDNVKLEGISDEPVCIVKYDFNEVAPPAPVLLHNWKLDESTATSDSAGIYGLGASAGTKFYLKNSTAFVDSYASSQGDYSVSKASLATASVNSTSAGKFEFYYSTNIYGNILCGAGGNPDTVVTYPYKGYSWATPLSGYLTGTSTAQTANVELPTTIDLPTLTSPATSFPSYSWGTHYLSNSYDVNTNVELNDGFYVIQGDVTIICNQFKLNGGSHVIVPAGSTLKVYAKSGIYISGGTTLNVRTSESDSTPNYTGASRVRLYTVNGSDFDITGGSTVVGAVYSTDYMHIYSSGYIYGYAAAAGEIRMEGGAAIHVDTDISGGGDSSSNQPVVAADDQGTADGTYYEGPVGPNDGKVGTSIHMDGVDDYIELPHHSNMLLDQGAIAFWFKADSVSGARGLLTKAPSDDETTNSTTTTSSGSGCSGSGSGSGSGQCGSGSGHHHRRHGCGSGDSNSTSTTVDDSEGLYVWLENGKINVSYESGSTSYDIPATSVSANTWYHVIYSWGGNGMKLYVNGVLKGTNPYTGGLAANTETIVMGGSIEASDLTEGAYYSGYFDDVRMYDRSFDTTQAATLYNGGTPGAGTNGYLVQDTSGYDSNPLDLIIENTDNVSWSDAGLTFNAPTRAMSSGAATKLYTALTATNKMSLDITFKTPDMNQSAPANIVSCSIDSYTRNFTFGQDMLQYVMKLRTSNSGMQSNSSNDVLTANTTQHVVVTYDGKKVRIYCNSSSSPVEIEQTGTFDDSWDSTCKLILGNENGSDQSWLGTISHIAIYDQALSSSQVQEKFGESNNAQATSMQVRWFENR